MEMNRKGAKNRNTKTGNKEKTGKKISPIPNSQKPANLDDWLEIGKIVAPQGLCGELRVYPESDFPERFEVPGTRWLWHPGHQEPQPVELLSGRYVEGKNLCVISLAGVENRNQAEALRNYKLMVPASHRPELGEDEYHVADLLGMLVFMQESGKLVGTVVDVISAGNDLLEVKLHEENDIVEAEKLHSKSPKHLLIPFVKEIAPVVDLQCRRIEITPPPGLLELAHG
ncbi:ribosome maturation factor RimM [Umezakia ovalisporum]|jgi:16S rRNA processing protein RimM|uniref:Ribosome maturation factor RimM n=2 Tax=Umezakia ovalisporum TaxID=75695 RepID=A0AA43KGK2_9CYAN|nr:ribosome maturation factor RimM [Umezakia ovalisporum]MBI1242757.1 ribosome maturation factor RimM [Nostoc sp. RI_552]MDH6057074.1 ribosome maturation factor RimM [Umezakia ovalisporum FSS-43]MDH6065023.1 ribosome maturation factor RimM [Umezakia ovalisporum FSS-62]MDH6067195.1 ribosome maturation factor RimM [Umezakia ovalisporum APH033B]MDH6071388.1 ribosome maturation factor RimM [Umezakia ovalisporum CobakiLakeA]